MSVKIIAIYFIEKDFNTKHSACKQHYIRYNVTFLTCQYYNKIIKTLVQISKTNAVILNLQIRS